MWIKSCSVKKWKKNYHFSTINISNSQIENLDSYSSSTKVNVNMFFPDSNFEGIVSTYEYGKLLWHNRELKIVCWSSRHILCEKYIKSFVCVEDRILVVKWIVYECHIFPMPLPQTCRLETTFLCLNSRLLVNKN